jgi:fatty-acyl-CoA synthase
MRIEQSTSIDAPREEVWELIKDPVEYAALLDWVTTFEPTDSDRSPGIGARYEMRVSVGSANVGGLVEIVEYDDCCDIVWTSVTGVEQRGRLRLRPNGDGQTRLTMRMSYGAPGALWGTLAELLSGPQISASVKRSLENVKREAEGTERPPLGGPSIPRRLAHELDNVWILAKRGMVSPMRPDKVARIALIGARWGASPAAGVLIGAVRHPDKTMIIDELGSLTYAEVDRRSNALANALKEKGIGAGDRVGLMCRDHRGFVEGMVAVTKLGADVLLLNTSFAAPQLTEVSEREEAAALIYDEEFEELTEEAGKNRQRFVVWHEEESQSEPTLGDLIEEGDDSPLPPPSRTGRVTILTSGTTGTPKGASRTSTPLTLDPPASLLERIPLHEGDAIRIGAPLFHTWGFSNFVLGMALGATFVLRRRFDPEQCLADIEKYRCDVLVVVPVMLQRILELEEEMRRRYDTSSLRAVCASGSALPGDLAIRWMDEFGDNLYNMYGSTEVAAATLATPKDMRRAPGTAGKPARGSIVRLYDDKGRQVLQGETGRIFVGNQMLFEGYTGGGSKDVIEGLMATGDIGRFDEAGRMFVEGRDDEMIVSGGENVFPKEVEDVLTGHDAVSEAAAVGVDDEKFGQRLKAFVVLSEGQQASEDDLKEHVKSNLARYKVPREIEFIDELPRNPTGKVLKRKLVEGDSEDEDGDGKSDEDDGAEEQRAEPRSEEDGDEGSEEGAEGGSSQSEDEARTEA